VNFLAHFHLAWPDEGLIAGALEGDYCKGPLRGQLPAPLERGVKLHRAIDAHTDNHPLILQLRRELPADLRRYAGILIDLSFDHYLSVHWSNFSSVPLQDFSREVYRILLAHDAILSEGSRSMLARLVEHDVLTRYQHWETVVGTAARIGERFGRRNPFLANPFHDLDRRLAPARICLERAFLNFYPQLQSFCTERTVHCTPPHLSIALEAKDS
jgi:acyl carrier protein phosphodiesterase